MESTVRMVKMRIFMNPVRVKFKPWLKQDITRCMLDHSVLHTVKKTETGEIAGAEKGMVDKETVQGGCGGGAQHDGVT